MFLRRRKQSSPPVICAIVSLIDRSELQSKPVVEGLASAEDLRLAFAIAVYLRLVLDRERPRIARLAEALDQTGKIDAAFPERRELELGEQAFAILQVDMNDQVAQLVDHAARIFVL